MGAYSVLAGGEGGSEYSGAGCSGPGAATSADSFGAGAGVAAEAGAAVGLGVALGADCAEALVPSDSNDPKHEATTKLRKCLSPSFEDAFIRIPLMLGERSVNWIDEPAVTIRRLRKAVSNRTSDRCWRP